MNENLEWNVSKPEEAVRVIFGGERTKPSGSSLALPSEFSERIAVANEVSGPETPVLAVVGDADARETLGWVATYAPEAFPLTQVLRVLGRQEFEHAKTMLGARNGLGREFIWPSIILGEILANGEAGQRVERVQIARTHACYSFVAARSQLLYKSDSLVSHVARDRLAQMEKGGLFAARPVPYSVLETIWCFADDRFPVDAAIRAIVETTVARSEGSSEGTRTPAFDDYALFDLDVAAISTGPIEQRIVEFERASLALVKKCATSTALRSRAALHLASMAFWVGSGTGHASLLDDFSRVFPEARAWLGLLAAMAGPKAWHGEWLRAVSAIERLIRAPFALTDPPTFDLCWMEYEFIGSQRAPVQWFADMPRLAARVLSVEVVPGAHLQLKLAGEGRADEGVDKQPATGEVPIDRERLIDGLGHMMSVLQDMTAMVSGPSSPTKQQESLFPADLAGQGAAAGRKRTSSKARK